MRVLILLLGLFCIGLSAPLLSQEMEHEPPENHDERCSTRHFKSESTGAIHTIMRCPNTGPAKRPANVSDTDGDSAEKEVSEEFEALTESEERVIRAQEDTALFTGKIWYWTKFGVLVGIPGLIFLGFTVWQNGRTFKHIQQNSIAEFKPYFSFGPLAGVKFRKDKILGEELFFQIGMTNIGKSSATPTTPLIDSINLLVGSGGGWKMYTKGNDGHIRRISHVSPGQTQLLEFSNEVIFDRNVKTKDGSGGHGTYISIRGHIELEDISTLPNERRRIEFAGRSHDWPFDINLSVGRETNGKLIFSDTTPYIEGNSRTLGLHAQLFDDFVFAVVDDDIPGKRSSKNKSS